MKKFTVGKEIALSRFLLDNYAGGLKYSRLMQLYRKKDVRVNGKRVSGDRKLAAGDVVEVYFDADPDELRCIYSDNDIAVFDKPAGIESSAFYEQVKAKYSGAVFTHRLDRNTSGIIAFALNGRAYDELFIGLKKRTFEKRYTALVYGFFEQKKGVLNDYLFKDEKNGRVTVCAQKRAGALPVKTGYEEIARGVETSAINVTLYTGRTHQIRAHLAFYGHFVIGDGKYGDDRINRKFGVNRQLLRATELILHFKEGDYLYRLNGKKFTVSADEILGKLK